MHTRMTSSGPGQRERELRVLWQGVCGGLDSLVRVLGTCGYECVEDVCVCTLV